MSTSLLINSTIIIVLASKIILIMSFFVTAIYSSLSQTQINASLSSSGPMILITSYPNMSSNSLLCTYRLQAHGYHLSIPTYSTRILSTLP